MNRPTPDVPTAGPVQDDRPWYARDTAQMGPVIVVMFVLLWVVVSPLRNNASEHATISSRLNVVIYFDWAHCQNDASIIEDPALRAAAVERCVLPPDKRDGLSQEQAYLFDAPYMSKVIAQAGQPVSGLSSSASGSSSSAPTRYTRRAAQENAEQQDEVHLSAIRGALGMEALSREQ